MGHREQILLYNKDWRRIVDYLSSREFPWRSFIRERLEGFQGWRALRLFSHRYCFFVGYPIGQCKHQHPVCINLWNRLSLSGRKNFWESCPNFKQVLYDQTIMQSRFSHSPARRTYLLKKKGLFGVLFWLKKGNLIPSVKQLRGKRGYFAPNRQSVGD